MSLAENIQRGGGTPVAMPFKYGTMDTMITDARMYPVTKKMGNQQEVTLHYRNLQKIVRLPDYMILLRLLLETK